MVKVNLLVGNPGGVRSGYINIDVKKAEDVADISEHVDAAEASEVVALDIIDRFPASDGDKVLDNWLSRLARGGVLTMSFVDVREVARGILSGKLSPEDIQELLHGRPEVPHDERRASYTVAQLAEVLANRGYTVLKKRVENYRGVVSVRRN
jgi:hypothetical protein